MSQRHALPTATDVVIIGGGIIGCSTAYFLAKKGLDVVVLEKNHKVAWEQSGRNWGFVRQLGRDPLELPLMKRSNQIWAGFEAELGSAMGWQQCGIMGMTDDEDGVSDYEEWRDEASQQDVPTRILSGKEVADLVPGMSRGWVAGIHVPMTEMLTLNAQQMRLHAVLLRLAGASKRIAPLQVSRQKAVAYQALSRKVDP